MEGYEMHTYEADMIITLMISWQLWLPVKKKKNLNKTNLAKIPA